MTNSKKAPWPEIVLGIGILFAFVGPFLLTRKSGIIDFSSTGEIGDTIGGITAPVVGLVGAYLVYLALKAQVKANQLIQDQLDEQRKSDVYIHSRRYLKEMYTHAVGILSKIAHVNPNWAEQVPDLVAKPGGPSIHQIYIDAEWFLVNNPEDPKRENFEAKLRLLNEPLYLLHAMVERMNSSETRKEDREMYKVLLIHQIRMHNLLIIPETFHQEIDMIGTPEAKGYSFKYPKPLLWNLKTLKSLTYVEQKEAV